MTSRVYARAALAGNPSDGYGGRTVAFTFQECFAEVTVAAAARLTIDAERGAGALLRAAYARFATRWDHTAATPKPCKLSVRSSIPPEVGLAGSSAIVIATLRALCEFNGVKIADAELPSVALAAEEDLGIPGGLQDRVAQVYDGLVYMDFDPDLLASDGHGAYERLDPVLLEHAYVAWCPRAASASSGFHRELRRRFRSGDGATLAALAHITDLAGQARDAIERADLEALGRVVDANFDLRRQLGPLEPHHVRMIDIARSVGASANYAGSGGAITGFLGGTEAFAALSRAMGASGCTVIRPTVAG